MYVAPVLLALFVIGCTTAVRRGKAHYTKLAETQPPSRISHPPDSRSQGASQLDRYRRSAVLGFRPCRERSEGGLTPALTALLFSGNKARRSASSWVERTRVGYESIVGWLAGRAPLAYTAALALTVLALAILPRLDLTLLPAFKERDLLIELTSIPGTSQPEMSRISGRIADELRTIHGVRSVAAHIGRDVPAVMHGDAIRLRQVLGNLVNNAVKFTEAGAVLVAVTVAASSTDQLMLEFSVTDTGVGVAPAEQKRIFDAFEQADGSVTRKFGGTGLGLAISRQLVELMHGHMALTSEPGRGSRFSFVIPAGVPRAEPVPAQPAPELGTLIIGMHPVIRSAVCDTISAESAHVISVDSPLSAIEALQDFGPGVTRVRVILDCNAAAKIDQAVSGLRAAAGPRQLEVVTLMPPDADSAPPQGVARSLVKPVCTPDLLSQVTAADVAQSMMVRVLPTSGSRGRALVVEDNAVNQEMARAMLDMIGFEVLTAANGQEGVNTAAANPDLVLILMDCQMPVMDGLAAARAIRAAEPAGRHVPIVALTGNAMPGDREACVAAGMDDYLAKPFSLTALRTTIDRWAGPALPDASRLAARQGR